MASENKEILAQILDKLFSLHRFGIKPGLERTEALLKLLGNPHKSFSTVHVAGTNGKGSTCSFIAAALTAAGYKVGLYTSPHIHKFNERIRVNGIEINDDDVVRLIEPLLDEAEKQHTTFFEITTAIAFQYFSEQEVDIAIIETGLGGRLDSTNVLSPLISVITSIDFDHMQYLGLTLRSIAGEKAGIIKRNTPVVVAESRSDLRNVFTAKAQKENADISFIHDKYTTEIIQFNTDFSMVLNIQSGNTTHEGLQISLGGEHQVNNIAAAIETLDILSKTFLISAKDLRYGLEHVEELTGIRSRIQLIQGNPPIVIDVGHNPACLQQLLETLTLGGYEKFRWNIIFAAMSDKNVSEMLEVLAPITKHLHLPALQYDRAMTPQQISVMATENSIKKITKYSSVPFAIQTILSVNEPTLIVGSFYLADEALIALDM